MTRRNEFRHIRADKQWYSDAKPPKWRRFIQSVHRCFRLCCDCDDEDDRVVVKVPEDFYETTFMEWTDLHPDAIALEQLGNDGGGGEEEPIGYREELP